jgi:hypothetical protein
MSAVDSAKFFLEDALLGNASLPPTPADISAKDFAGWLKTEVDEFFDQDVVEVVLDQNMSSKALAGASRIRLRGSAFFSQLDKDQLLYHEAFIHTATILNGKKQLNLKSLGLEAPRTTRTQEGLAVMAELITNAMDINRLRRVALRVLAIKQALDGAALSKYLSFSLAPIKQKKNLFARRSEYSEVVVLMEELYLPKTRYTCRGYLKCIRLCV